MLPTSDTLIPLIQTSYWVLFFLVMLEGPLVTMLAGGAVAGGFLNGPLVLLLVCAADLLADTLYYALGRWGREGVIIRWGRYVGLTVQRVEKLEERFESHGLRLLLIGKLSHGVGGAFLVAAGLAGMPLWQFLAANTAATVPKSLALLAVGYYFGQAIGQANRALGYVTVATVGLLAVLLVGYLISRRARKEGM